MSWKWKMLQSFPVHPSVWCIQFVFNAHMSWSQEPSSLSRRKLLPKSHCQEAMYWGTFLSEWNCRASRLPGKRFSMVSYLGSVYMWLNVVCKMELLGLKWVGNTSRQLNDIILCINIHRMPVVFQFLSICKKGSSAPESAIAGIILILSILGLMLLLMYCFNHEERLASLFQRHVVQRCREIQRISKFKVQDPLKRITSWLTMVEKYREGASPKKQTITIRFENLSLVLKKVKFRW